MPADNPVAGNDNNTLYSYIHVDVLIIFRAGKPIGSLSGMILQRNANHYLPAMGFVLLSSRFSPLPSRLAVSSNN